VDSTVTDGTRYTYWVTASNTVGEGPAAGPRTVVPGAAPSAPVGLSVNAHDRSAALNWQPPANVGSPAAASYVIYRSTAADTAGTQIGTSSTTAFNDTNLVNGTTY